RSEANADRVSGGSQVLRPALRSFPVPTIAGRDSEAAGRDLSVGVDHVGILLPAVGGDPWGRLHCLGLAGFEIYEPRLCEQLAWRVDSHVCDPNDGPCVGPPL